MLGTGVRVQGYWVHRVPGTGCPCTPILGVPVPLYWLYWAILGQTGPDRARQGPTVARQGPTVARQCPTVVFEISQFCCILRKFDFVILRVLRVLQCRDRKSAWSAGRPGRE